MGGLTHDAIRTWNLVGPDVYSHTVSTSCSDLRAKSIDEGYAGKPIRSHEIFCKASKHYARSKLCSPHHSSEKLSEINTAW